MVMKNIVSLGRVRQRQKKGSERTGSKGRTEGGMYVEVDGWCIESGEKSRAE